MSLTQQIKLSAANYRLPAVNLRNDSTRCCGYFCPNPKHATNALPRLTRVRHVASGSWNEKYPLRRLVSISIYTSQRLIYDGNIVAPARKADKHSPLRQKRVTNAAIKYISPAVLYVPRDPTLAISRAIENFAEINWRPANFVHFSSRPR